MDGSRRSELASNAARALAAQLSPERLRWRAQRGALARHHRDAFETLKAHERVRQKTDEEVQLARKVVDLALEQEWRNLSNYAEMTLLICRDIGVIPFVRPGDDTLYIFQAQKLTPRLNECLRANRDELVEVLARCLQRACDPNLHQN
jgi:hypothetical protein